MFLLQLGSLVRGESCDKDLKVYIIGHHFGLLVSVLVVSEWRKANLPSVFKSFVFTFFFEVVWSILGVGWFAKADWNNRACISSFEFVQSILVQTTMILGVLGLIIYSGLLILKARGTQTSFWSGNDVPNEPSDLSTQLKNIYKETTPSKDTILRVLESSKGLEKISLLPEEKLILEKYCATSFDLDFFQKVSGNEKNECSPCCQIFEPACKVTQLFCGHFFHDECIWKALNSKMACPKCRACVRTSLLQFVLIEAD